MLGKSSHLDQLSLIQLFIPPLLTQHAGMSPVQGLQALLGPAAPVGSSPFLP